MLEQYLEIKLEQDSSCSPTDDAKTLAAARTSNCHPIEASLRLAEPQALTTTYSNITAGPLLPDCIGPTVINLHYRFKL
jgi:hypothetical protein